MLFRWAKFFFYCYNRCQSHLHIVWFEIQTMITSEKLRKKNECSIRLQIKNQYRIFTWNCNLWVKANVSQLYSLTTVSFFISEWLWRRKKHTHTHTRIQQVNNKKEQVERIYHWDSRNLISMWVIFRIWKTTKYHYYKTFL